MAHYLDTSALVRLVIREPGSRPLRTWLLHGSKTLVTSDLARTELVRAVRAAAPDRAVKVREILDVVTIVQVTTSVFEEAGRLEPPLLRSLDAIHLAAALTLGDDLETVVTYDRRMADAAGLLGLPVTAPV